ncbi:MAG: polyphosphate kinase 1 [Colwellia sp.]
MKENVQFLDKEISWLAFNERVLQEAQSELVPIIERIHFLGIYSSNLDEFFRVQVADIRRRALLEAAKNTENPNTENTQSTDLLKKVLQLVALSSEKFKAISTTVFAQLEDHNIQIIANNDINVFNKKLSSSQFQWLTDYFNNKIIHHITPITIQSNTQFSACLDDEGIYFLVSLTQDEKVKFALVEIPREKVSRFIVLPVTDLKEQKHGIVFLDDVVKFFMDKIFCGAFAASEIEAYSMKLTRDAEYNLTNELDDSLLNQMSKGLKQRLRADLVRLVHDREMPNYMLKFLKKSLKIKELDNIVQGGTYRHFKDFIGFPNLGNKALENEDFITLESAQFKKYPSVFSAISAQDILIYYPYYKFSHFTEFIRQAAFDTQVKKIKINIYRVAKHSHIIPSLIEAVKNGKQVTVVVELRARFDEEANINWAKLMKDAGIKVEFGIETLKIHSKLCLISRIEEEKTVHYAHIGTGNFHENNARIYTDFSLFTKHKDICQEVNNIFSFVSHSYKRYRFNHLIVSPLTSRRRLYNLIDSEIQIAEKGNKAAITLKLNNLVDKGLINRLYSASTAGVKISLIIRGMCSLIPNIEGVSENITIISIIDRFLEHPRVMVFNNNDDPLVYISSADWMARNIDHRVEVACPIYDEKIKSRIIRILDLHLKDNVKARLIDKNLTNTFVKSEANNKKPLRSQVAIYEYLQQEELDESNRR